METFYPEKLIYERVSTWVMEAQSTLAAHVDSVIHTDPRMLTLTSQTAHLCQDPFVNPLTVLSLVHEPDWVWTLQGKLHRTSCTEGLFTY